MLIIEIPKVSRQ